MHVVVNLTKAITECEASKDYEQVLGVPITRKKNALEYYQLYMHSLAAKSRSDIFDHALPVRRMDELLDLPGYTDDQ